MNIFAIDPGRTTGIAWGWIDRTWQVTRPGWAQIDTSTLRDVKIILDMINEFRPDVVVYEDFIIRTLAADPHPMTIIDILEWELGSGFGQYAGAFRPDTLKPQQPAERSIINDGRLKRMELYQPGQPHANDAMRHLVVYSRKMRVDRGT